MDEKKPSTSDILAKIRAQKAAAAAGSSEGASAAPAAPAPVDVSPAPAIEAAAAETSAEPVPQPSAPVAKPGGTKDILAAIRAQGAKGAKPTVPAAAASAPVAAPAVAAAARTVAASAPTGPLPSVAEMVRAARTGVVPEPAEKPLVAPPMPVKPPAPAAKPAPSAARRSIGSVAMAATISATSLALGFLLSSPLLMALGVLIWAILLTPFMLAWASFGVVGGISVLGVARFMFPNVLVEPPSKFKVGPASDYPLNTVSNKWKDQFGIWIVHTDQYEGKDLIYALSTVCTHLGCTPNWLDGEQKFKCPCHGSGFYITGVNFEGPAPRPLERVGLRRSEDGLLEVDKSLKFQEEMGQWTDQASFVEVV